MLTERSRRVWAATEAQAIGYGGTALVARATGIATSTIQRGLRELTADEPLAGGRTRRAGGGRKARDRSRRDAAARFGCVGRADRPRRSRLAACGGTCQSARTLAVALDGLGHRVSHTVVAELLHGLGYSLQGNAKTREGRQHVDRDAQFRYIAGACDARNGNSSRRFRWTPRRRSWSARSRTRAAPGARRRRRSGQVHDFVSPGHRHHGREGHSVWHLRSASQTKAGECRDRSRHRELRGTVDPALVAAQGRPAYRQAQSLLITADAGGSNGARLPVVEVGTAASGQSDGLGDHGLSLSAGDEQVEQDRASVVLAHRDELARHPTRRLGHDREPHCLDVQSVRTPRSVGTRPRPIPGWHHRHRCAAGDGTPRAAIAFTATGTTRSIPLLREHKSQ